MERSRRLVVFALAAACTPAARLPAPTVDDGPADDGRDAYRESVTLMEGCGPCCAVELLYVETPERTRIAGDVAQPIASRYRPEGGGGWRECIGDVSESMGWRAEAAFELTASGRAKRVAVVVEPPQPKVQRCLTGALAKLTWPPSRGDGVTVLAIYTRMAAYGPPP